MRVPRWAVLSLCIAPCLMACGGPREQCSQDSDCGADAACDVSVKACVTCETDSCQGFQQCVRANCAPRYKAITPLRPQSVGTLSPLATIRVRLELADGRARRDPPFLTFAILDAEKREGPPLQTGQLGPVGDGTFEGPWRQEDVSNLLLVVKYEEAGLVTELVPFTQDNQPPTVQLSVSTPVRRDNSDPLKADERDLAPQFGDAWRRDERVDVSIGSSEPLDLDASNLVLTAAGSAVSAPAKATASAGCGQPFCATASVDLAEPPMAAFRTTFGLKLTTKDVAGNPGQGTGSIKVTRQKWRFSVGNEPVQTSPSVGFTGGIYFATSSGGTRLYGVKPNGEFRWSLPPESVGTVRGTIAVAKVNIVDLLYMVVDKGGNSYQVEERNGSDGAFSEQNHCLLSGNSSDGSGTLMNVAGKRVFASVVGGVGTATLIAYTPEAADAPGRCRTFSTGLRAIDYPGNIASSGSDIFWGDQIGQWHSHNLATGWSVRSGWPIANAFPSATALTPSEVVSSTWDGPDQGRAIAVLKSGSALSWMFPAAGGFLPAASGPVIGAQSRVLFGDRTPRLSAVGLRGNAGISSSSGTLVGSPLLGEKGLIYLADDAGTLSVRDSNLNVLWSNTFVGASFQASPNIDCTRDADGRAIPGRPGVLYLASTAGTVDAIVVDSRGIDTSAPWPKYQHDPRNTGNADTDLSEFACP